MAEKKMFIIIDYGIQLLRNVSKNTGHAWGERQDNPSLILNSIREYEIGLCVKQKANNKRPSAYLLFQHTSDCC